MIAVDSNILVYAFDVNARHHDVALSTLGRLASGAERWGLPIFAIGEFLRVVTHRAILDPPAEIDQALASIELLIKAPTSELLRPGEQFVRYLRAAMEDGDASGNRVFDAQIVAVCLENGVEEILTEDKDFRRFDSIRTRRLPTS